VLHDGVTDGAKAWTRDGFYRRGHEGPVVVNTLTGSNVDLVLAENPLLVDANPSLQGIQPYNHIKSLVKIFVYAPANGLVKGGTPIWTTTIHKVWYVPVATTLVYTPARQMGIAGRDVVTTQAQVLDQQGNPMAGVLVSFTTQQAPGLEGVGIGGEPPFSMLTNAQGIAIYNIGETTGDWGIGQATATVVGLPVKNVLIDWGLNDPTRIYGSTLNGSQIVHINAGGFASWDGKTMAAYLNPAGAIIGSGIYNVLNNLNITTSHTFVTGEFWYVNVQGSTDTDAAPNWLSGVTP